MTNTERLLLHTLPRWSGVTVTSVTELLSDMWIRGEQAGHHSALAYDPDGIDLLRAQIRRDFKSAPPAASFRAGIKAVGDLDDAMQGVEQRPLDAAVLLRASLAPEGRKELSRHVRTRESRGSRRRSSSRGGR
jgi:hypothetical protein